MHSVRRCLAALAAALVAGAVLTGCVGQDPQPTHSPSPSATPLYSSDEEALAAAKEAYARYVDVSNEVAHGGWADLSPLKTVTSGDALKGDLSSGETNHSKGLHVTGDLVGEVRSVQKVGPTSVSTYACLNVASTRIVDQNGVDRTSPNRSDVYPFEVIFSGRGDEMKISRSSIWSGDSFC